MKKIYLSLLFTVITCAMFAQQRDVSGIVVNKEKKEPIAGASVFVKGTEVGVVTDGDGKFIIKIKPGQSLEAEFMGFDANTVAITADTKNVVIELTENAINIEETVIVGFSQQKKESVVSSIATVKPSDLKVPSSNLTTALGGRIAGLMAVQKTGEPGRDENSVDFFVRGSTSFQQGVRNPLILIDGAESTTSDFARLQTDDIEQFSVLKDAAAAAVYGARGANGVILVTTKTGKEGKAKIDIRYETTVSMPTRTVDLADPVTYMKFHNEAVRTRNPLGVLPYTEDKIANTVPGANPMVYPQVDWYDMLFKNSTLNQHVNLNVSGGGSVARYYVAASYSRDNGILRNDGNSNFNNNISVNKYTLRTNFDINATKTTKLGFRLLGDFADYSGPLEGGDAIYGKVINANPVMFPAIFNASDVSTLAKHTMFGNAGTGQYNNPYADMVKGYKENSETSFNAQINLNQDLKGITKGLSARVMANTRRSSFYEIKRSYTPFKYVLDSYDKETGRYNLTCLNLKDGSEALGYEQGGKRVDATMYMEAAINYDRTFKDKHNVMAMFVYNMRNETRGNESDFLLSLPKRNMGIAGRVTYGFDSRYFIEANFGYNGSERFDKSHRWGFFPSAGASWIVSNEKFYGDNLKKVLSSLKVKGTFGLVGNDAIGDSKDRFFYLSDVNLANGDKEFRWGSEYSYNVTGVSTNRYANPEITWETSTKTDIGIEIGLFNKINIVADYFYDKREDMLQDRASIPSTAGFSAAVRANVGASTAEGFDASLEYTQDFGKHGWIRGNATFTYATSKYLIYEEPDYTGLGMPWRTRVGNNLSQNWGYVAERLFIDDYDVWNSPSQTGFGNEVPVQGGDIKYKDINNDGKISDIDKVPIGYPTNPEVMYGFGLSGGYKGFDLSFFFQGSARSSFWIDANGVSPFINQQKALMQVIADDVWTEENPNSYAFWPRLSEVVSKNNTQTSTWFMRNGSFLRLKQIEAGYTLPDAVQKKLKMKNLRVYVNLNNIASFSKFKLWDTEMGGNGLNYPIQFSISAGLNVSF